MTKRHGGRPLIINFSYLLSLSNGQILYRLGVAETVCETALINRTAVVRNLFTKSPPTSEKPTITLENLNKPGSTSVVIDILVNNCREAYEKLSEVGVEFLTPPNKPLGKQNGQLFVRCFFITNRGNDERACLQK